MITTHHPAVDTGADWGQRHQQSVADVPGPVSPAARSRFWTPPGEG